MSTKTYNVKSNAVRAAKSQGLTNYVITKHTDGTFFINTKEGPAAMSAPAPVAAIVETAGAGLGRSNAARKPAKAAPALKSKGMRKSAAWKVQEKGRKAAVRDKVSTLPAVKLSVDVHTSAKAASKIIKRAGAAEAGYQIEKNRAAQNGQVRPSSTTVGGNLWAMFDKMAAELGGPKHLTVKHARLAAEKVALSVNSGTIAYYYWRKFNGIRGRTNLKKAAA